MCHHLPPVDRQGRLMGRSAQQRSSGLPLRLGGFLPKPGIRLTPGRLRIYPEQAVRLGLRQEPQYIKPAGAPSGPVRRSLGEGGIGSPLALLLRRQAFPPPIALGARHKADALADHALVPLHDVAVLLAPALAVAAGARHRALVLAHVAEQDLFGARLPLAHLRRVVAPAKNTVQERRAHGHTVLGLRALKSVARREGDGDVVIINGQQLPPWRLLLPQKDGQPTPEDSHCGKEDAPLKRSLGRWGRGGLHRLFHCVEYICVPAPDGRRHLRTRGIPLRGDHRPSEGRGGGASDCGGRRHVHGAGLCGGHQHQSGHGSDEAGGSGCHYVALAIRIHVVKWAKR
mmetsp:Transcript_40985/g.68842  ORF Transcript_40985/g.68842 Transcript_40985/m.68842 type:complete len:343 (+) Transcript_40985:532-1560(+)